MCPPPRSTLHSHPAFGAARRGDWSLAGSEDGGSWHRRDPRLHPMTTRNRLLALCALVAALVGAFVGAALAAAARNAAPSAEGAPQPRPTVIDFVQISGVMDPPTAHYLLRQLDNAPGSGAGLVVIQLDTPGGLNAPVRRIAEAVVHSKVPVVAWVSPSGARGASAGAFVTLAANVVAMAPGSTLGPATPADLGQHEPGPAASP